MKEVIVKSVEQLNEKKTCSLVKKAFKDGYDRKFIIDCLQDGMDRVGKLYESNTYYIADLIMAGMIFKKILEMDQMNPDKTAHDDEVRGIILVGTVEKDIHAIGKDLFAVFHNNHILMSAGYEQKSVIVYVSQVAGMEPAVL